MRLRGWPLLVLLAAACGIAPTPTPIEDEPVLLPGDQALPDGAAGATAWNGTAVNVAGFDADEVHPTPESLGEAFVGALQESRAGSGSGRSYGSEALEERPDRTVVLVTESGLGDDSLFGSQYALVLAGGEDGWSLSQLYVRTLCRRGVSGEVCV